MSGNPIPEQTQQSSALNPFHLFGFTALSPPKIKPAYLLKYFCLVVSWGLRKDNKKKVAFRPAMELASGELSGIGGKFILMTATASSSTRRLLMNQLPELMNWEIILNSPMRSNVSIIVPLD